MLARSNPLGNKNVSAKVQECSCTIRRRQSFLEFKCLTVEYNSIVSFRKSHYSLYLFILFDSHRKIVMSKHLESE